MAACPGMMPSSRRSSVATSPAACRAFDTVSGALGGVGHAVTSVAQSVAPGLTQSTDPVASFQQSLQAPVANDLKDATTSLARTVVTGDTAARTVSRGALEAASH